MPASSKRRALALGAPFALAVALAVAVSGRGCAEDDAGPTEATRVFLEAAAELDREGMFEMLGPKTRATLEGLAREATDRSSRRYAPREMIGLDSGLEIFDLEGASDLVSTVASDDDQATVEITDRAGGKHRLELVRIDDRWLIEL